MVTASEAPSKGPGVLTAGQTVDLVQGYPTNPTFYDGPVAWATYDTPKAAPVIPWRVLMCGRAAGHAVDWRVLVTRDREILLPAGALTTNEDPTRGISLGENSATVIHAIQLPQNLEADDKLVSAPRQNEIELGGDLLDIGAHACNTAVTRARKAGQLP